MTTRGAIIDAEQNATKRADSGRGWIARRELSFFVNGKSVVVKNGERVPDKCWAACNDAQIARIIANRLVREV